MTADAATPAPQEIDSLIERCLTGDQAAWEAHRAPHWRKVFNIAYKFVGRHDEAEDLTQDIFLKLFKSIEHLRSPRELLDVADQRQPQSLHRPLPQRAPRARAVTHDVDVVTLARPSAIDSPHAMLERRDRVALLRAALDKLRAVAAHRRHAARHPGAELPGDRGTLGVPEGTVKSRINRGRTELARQIARLREQQERARRKGVRHGHAPQKTGASR